MNERIVIQLAQRVFVPVAEMVHSPESSPYVSFTPPPAAARAGAGIVDITGGGSDNDYGSPSPPLHSFGSKTTGLEFGSKTGLLELGDNSSPTFSVRNLPLSQTDTKVSRYSLFACLVHYMDRNKISKANRAAVEICISVKAGSHVCSMDPMKKDKKEKAFFNKYMGIVDEIDDDQFEDNSVCDAMCCCHKKAKLNNNPACL